MGKCCIPTCRNSVVRAPGLTFHQIPSNEPWRTEWIEVLRKQGVDGLTEWTLVCADHFTHEDYKMTARKNFLLQTAVPSVFNATIDTAPPPKKRGRKPKQQKTFARSAADGEDDDPTYPRRTGRQRKKKVYKDMVVFMPDPAMEDSVSGEAAECPTVVAKVADGDGEARPVQITIPMADEPIAFRTETIAADEESYSENANSSDVPSEEPPENSGADKGASEFTLVSSAPPAAEQTDGATGDPPKNLNIIVFSSRPRPQPPSAPTGNACGEQKLDQPRSKRRCCQIQTQRLLFYKSVIVKLRKRVLALEASLQEKEQELEALKAGES